MTFIGTYYVNIIFGRQTIDNCAYQSRDGAGSTRPFSNTRLSGVASLQSSHTLVHLPVSARFSLFSYNRMRAVEEFHLCESL